jgi:hypothetical protein
LPDKGGCLAVGPLADRDLLFDLFHDLDAHRPLVGQVELQHKRNFSEVFWSDAQP